MCARHIGVMPLGFNIVPTTQASSFKASFLVSQPIPIVLTINNIKPKPLNLTLFEMKNTLWVSLYITITRCPYAEQAHMVCVSFNSFQFGSEKSNELRLWPSANTRSINGFEHVVC